MDSNNKWLIEPYNGTIHNETFVPLINGMKIRLKHINTGRRLHSHDEKPPVSERDWQRNVHVMDTMDLLVMQMMIGLLKLSIIDHKG